MRYCARCKRPRDRDDKRTGKGQRLCRKCHRENMVEHRAKMKRRRKTVDEFLRRNALSFESRV